MTYYLHWSVPYEGERTEFFGKLSDALDYIEKHSVDIDLNSGSTYLIEGYDVDIFEALADRFLREGRANNSADQYFKGLQNEIDKLRL